MQKILFLDKNHPLLHENLSKAGFVCEHDYASSKEEVENKIANYSGIVIRSRFKIDKSFIDKATNLKFIARVGAGMENIDVAYAESKGIKCLHAPEGNRDAVGEHAIGMLLSLFNNLNKADREVREGKWLREENRGEELQGKTIGIIGFGNMGSAFAQRLKGFDVKVLVYDKYKKIDLSPPEASGLPEGNGDVEQVDMKKIFEEADVVSIHLPLTDETNYLINDSFINSFKKNIYIINTSRGKCLNTDDLVKNIKIGKVLGACLDVLEYESTSFEGINSSNNQQPTTINYLLSSNKVILSPHIAGWTYQSNEKMARVLAEKILKLN